MRWTAVNGWGIELTQKQILNDIKDVGDCIHTLKQLLPSTTRRTHYPVSTRTPPMMNAM